MRCDVRNRPAVTGKASLQYQCYCYSTYLPNVQGGWGEGGGVRLSEKYIHTYIQRLATSTT